MCSRFPVVVNVVLLVSVLVVNVLLFASVEVDTVLLVVSVEVMSSGSGLAVTVAVAVV